MPNLILIKAEIPLATRRQRQIKNEINRDEALYGAHLEIQQWRTDLKDAIHREEVGPCRTFNCHGLTFGARRTWIDDPIEVQKILDDDDYMEVQKASAKPGDIAVFRKGGEIWHSGIVVEIVPLKGPRILGKWAMLHEVVHFPFEGPYSDCQVTYHRIAK